MIILIRLLIRLNKTAEKWESIQEKALGWKGIDRFGKIHETVDW